MKILMIVFHFPPLNQMASSRSYAFAKYWSKMGYEVTVITPKKYIYHGKLNYKPNEKIDINLIEVSYAKWLTRRFEKDKLSKEESINILRKVIRYLRKHLIGNAFDTQKLWEKAVYQEADRLMRDEAFDVVFSSFSPPTPHLIASKLKAKYPNIFWVADYRDLWNGNHLLKINRFLSFFEKKREKKVLKNADLIVTVSEGFKTYLENFHRKKVFTIFNGYDKEEIDTISQDAFFPPDDKIRFVYTGTIYVGTRDPAPFFKAVKRLEKEALISPKKFEIWFFGDSANVMEIAAKESVKSYVKIGDYLTKEDAYRAQRDADGLLFLEEQSKESDLSFIGTIPAKLYESLLAKTEIFAIGVHGQSFAGDLIKRSLTGDFYEHNVDKIYNRLKEFINEKNRTVEPDLTVIERFSREKIASDLLALIKEYR